jgi:hypothetical protein
MTILCRIADSFRSRLLPLERISVPLSAWLTLFTLIAFSNDSRGADFTVTSPGFLYSIDGMQPNPTLTLVRGQTYTFAISTAGNHPFQIISPPGTTTNNNISSGTITFVVPTNAVNYTYRCSIHGFGGTILTVGPPSPPTIQVVSLAVGTNLVLKSTGTNNWSVIPEFSTNLSATSWLALTVQTNRFANGTNETFCGRPPGDAVFIRIRAQPTN